MRLFTGAGTALVTPYKNGVIDFERYGELIDWQIEQGIDAIITAGTTGEAATMSDTEHKSIMKFAVERVKGRVPVIAGTGSNDTQYGLKLSQYAEEVGVDGLLMVTPYYNKSTQTAIVKHFEYIADRVNIPIILYNVPGRTGFNIGVKAVVELSKHKNIVAIKEASGNISYLAELASNLDDDFAIYSGNDDMVVPILSLGGKGVISVVSNVLPKETHDMVMHFLNGDIEKSREIQLKLNGFIKALFIETNPIPVKTCMNILGMDVGDLRLPLAEMEEKNKQILINEMEKIGLEKVVK